MNHGNNDSFSPIILFIPLLLVFSAIREIIGLGTISFPVYSGLFEFVLISPSNVLIFRFLGTGGGALMLTGIFSFIIKISLIKKELKNNYDQYPF